MLLALDIGNSTIGAALFPAGEDSLVRLENIPTNVKRPRGEYGPAFRERLQSSAIAPGKITAAIISSVVPALTDTFLAVVEETTGIKPLPVSPALFSLLPVKIAEASAGQVGADIVCNAAGAYARFGKPCVVVNFGTGLTFTAIGATGSLLGVAIAPGISLALQSLVSGTALLSTVPLEAPASCLGHDTTSAIQSGIVFGAVGLAESLVKRFIGEMCHRESLQKNDIQVIATGGLCGLAAPLADIFHHVERDLIFHGLWHIAKAARLRKEK